MAKIPIDRYRTYENQQLITARNHPCADLIIWNYTASCQWRRAWDEVTLQARGLITKSDGTIVSRPFPKFFNLEELEAVPSKPFTVTEKMDGSLGISYCIDDVAHIATRGSFTSEQAIHATDILHRLYPAFAHYIAHDPGHTYLFEIIYPDNQIVVDYGDLDDLVLLAIIDVETGREEDISCYPFPNNCPPLVKRYDDIEDIAILKTLEEHNKEGFVLRFSNGLRAKCKFDEYKRLHRLLTGINTRAIWDLLRNNQPLTTLFDRVPDEFYEWVETTVSGFLKAFHFIEHQAKMLYEQVKLLPTRKEQAYAVAGSELSSIVFAMLDHKDYNEIIWRKLRPQAERPFRESEEN
jgi:RNA ligase